VRVAGQQAITGFAVTANRMSHDLNQHFTQLRKFSNSRQLEESVLYARLRDEVERVLGTVIGENIDSDAGLLISKPLRAIAWNIERGIKLDGILSVLKSHPLISSGDLFFLTELDYGMARSGNREVAREIATRLGLSYAFAPCYINLNKGSGLECEVQGENAQALHGNALFSRYPLLSAHSVPLPNGKDKMQGKEKRLGSQRAVVGLVDHPSGRFWAVSLHLDAHSSQRHRHRQMRIVLDHLDRLEPRCPVLIGGDWNTSTYNSRRATYAILGYLRRVAMGVRHVIKNHYPYPERWFERRLFRELEARGYNYKDLNQLGACTLHYDVRDLALNRNMGDWIPGWCFWFIDWALKKNTGNEGKCSLKLDWFAGRGIVPERNCAPLVITGVRNEGLLSDHDPILVDFRLAAEG
jgi:endonuclease/exonuclease/phosphatase family metal-dependent hydrolase